MATKAASLADDLVRRFERAIEAGEMAPGARFPTEKSITEDFNVSRTVVREAFARLAARGLLVSRRGSGAYVADGARYQAFQVTPDELGQIGDLIRLLEMRMGVEAEMAGLAAERRTEDDLSAIRAALDAMDRSTDVGASVDADTAFHAAISAATKNDYFVRLTQFLGVRLVPSRQLYMTGTNAAQHQRIARRINQDHLAIYAAIAAGDGTAARRAARRHMEKSLRRYANLQQQMADETR